MVGIAEKILNFINVYMAEEAGVDTLYYLLHYCHVVIFCFVFPSTDLYVAK